jgi:hypothetical protein
MRFKGFTLAPGKLLVLVTSNSRALGLLTLRPYNHFSQLSVVVRSHEIGHE